MSRHCILCGSGLEKHKVRYCASCFEEQYKSPYITKKSRRIKSLTREEQLRQIIIGAASAGVSYGYYVALLDGRM